MSDGVGHGDACTPVAVTADDGARITACAHGGHLLTWQPAGPDGEPGPDLLWLSPIARCGPGLAIRGGVPVIFPQFAARGPLPKHGLARDRAWVLVPGPDDASGAESSGAAVLEATLTDDASTRALWPHAFALTLRMAAHDGRLELTMRVTDTGEEPFAFTAALHSYLAAEPGATVHGLDGATAQDKAAGLTEIIVPSGPLPATAARDLAVRGLADEVRLTRPDHGVITLWRTGFADLVMWNPGPEHGLADVPEDRADFVCLEPAQLTPVTLEPGSSWAASAVFEHTGPFR